MKDYCRIALELDARERATVIAALAFWIRSDNNRPQDLEDHARDWGALAALDRQEIKQLVHRLCDRPE